MAQIKNERDVVIGGSNIRVLATNNNYIQLTGSSQYFKVSSTGQVSSDSIDITANLFGVLTGTVTFSVPAGTGTLVVDGNTATLTYENMLVDFITVTASLEYLGNTYEATYAISKIRDGATGGSGDSVDIVFIKNTTQPTTPPLSSATPAGWYSNISEIVSSDVTIPVWASVGKKLAGEGNLYTWSIPYLVGASSIVELTIYKRSLETLTTPVGGSYSFTTKQLTAPEGWTSYLPEGTAPIYTSRTTAAIYGAEGLDNVLTWSPPVLSIQNSVVLLLDSSTQVINTDEYGAQYTYPTGNAVKLYSGGVLQTTPNVVYSGTASKNGLTLTVNSSTGALTLDGINWVSEKESFVISATYAGVNYQTVYTVQKSRAGTSSIIPDLLKETEIVFSNNDGTGYTLPQGNKVLLYRGNSTLTSGVAYGIQGTTQLSVTKNGLTFAVDASTGDITLSGNSWSSNEESVVFTATYEGTQYLVTFTVVKARTGASGEDITSLYFTSGETVVVQSNYAGTVYTLPAGTTAVLYSGATPLTTGVQYNIIGSTQSVGNTDLVYKTQSNLTVFISKTTGAITFSGTTWNSNLETFTFTATHNSVVYNKQLTVAKLKAGEATVSAILISEADVVPANSQGLGYVFPSITNELQVYVGPTKVTSGVTYGGTATKNGLTLTINSVGGITLSGTNWISNAESFTVTATYNSIVYSKIYTISKSVAGTDAVVLDLDRESAATVANSDGTGYTLPGVTTASLYSGGSKVTSGVVYNISGAVSSAKTQNGLTATINSTTGAITLTGASWTSTFEEFVITATYNSITYTQAYKVYKLVKGVAGDSAIVLDLRSEADVIASDAYGTTYLYPPANKATLYVGGLEKTTGVVFGVSGGTSGVKTQNGLTLTVNTSTGVITYSGPAWGTTQESFDITATYLGNTYTASYIITKAKAGTSAVNIDLLAESVVVTALTNGTGYSLPATNYIYLYLGAEKLTSGVTYSGTATKNGLTATVDAALGTVTMSAPSNSWTTDTETFDLVATYQSIPYTARYTVAKSKQGLAGTVGNSARVCYSRTTLTSLATTPSTITSVGSTSFPANDSWGTGTIWQATPPVISAGQSVYQSNGIYDPATGNTTWTVPFLSSLKVGQLSAITADLGTITAGSISGTSIRIGNNAAVSGSSMTGTGLVINTNGTFALGNPITNMSFNGSRLTLNGDIVTAANIQQGAVTYINSVYSDASITLSSNYFVDVYTSVLWLDVYCAGGPVLIIPNVDTSSLTGLNGTTYYATSSATFSSTRTIYFGIAKTNTTTTTVTENDWLRYSARNVNSLGLTAFDPNPAVGYNRYHLVIREVAIPSTANRITRGSRGTWFRNFWVNQTK